MEKITTITFTASISLCLFHGDFVQIQITLKSTAAYISPLLFSLERLFVFSENSSFGRAIAFKAIVAGFDTCFSPKHNTFTLSGSLLNLGVD